ncbi:hypothetical protein PR003_g24691 [Phytophthora rubi]|uniref:Myb-like domain-containing protein n=1 Tax=Phytophthora rubi TaxID=129364 RepID=A0A6A4CVX7_9STRA|nr:hypothetical protein PR001_g26187 [Phytophthora rubi]KAE9292709.1 hypothetical protein PR003_g24691 [Phytophthora rubi]
MDANVSIAESFSVSPRVTEAVEQNDGAANSGAGSMTDEGALPILKTRKRFGPDEDLLLIKEVNWILSYRKGRNNVMNAWKGIADRLNKLRTFNMESVNNKSCQNRFNTLLARHRVKEAESARASGVDEDYIELRGLMDDIMSDFDEWASKKQNIKDKNALEEEAKDCAGAVVRDSAMQRLKEQREADARRPGEKEQDGSDSQLDSTAQSSSKDTPTKSRNAILASLVPLLESSVQQAQGIQEVLREEIKLRHRQDKEMLAVRKREREEEFEDRRAQRNQDFQFRQAQMEAETRRIR